MKQTAVILAGGRGERFWPKSRKDFPKQFLALTPDGKSMLQNTARRTYPLAAPDDIFVVTNAAYREPVREHLPEISPAHILCEPCGRGTAPCLYVAAREICRLYGDALMIVLPSDHVIRYEQMYEDVLRHALAVAEQTDGLITIGIPPTYPETGYGYIRFARDVSYAPLDVYRVEKFVEKPDRETARAYVASEKYLWNSGMFVWKASAISKAIEQYLPDMACALATLPSIPGEKAYDDALKSVYPTLESVSIDVGVLEKADNIYTIPGDFGWDDAGSFNALSRIRPTDENGNCLAGDVIASETKRAIIWGSKRLIAAVGVRDLIVVDTDDVLLLCAREEAQDIRRVVETLRENGREELL